MKKEYNIYIDESCHLENDDSNVMCIGYTKLPTEKYTALKEKIIGLKLKHKSPTEIKWNLLSLSRWELYKELIDLFFFNDIDFRAILIKDKKNLSPEKLSRLDQDSYYYKTLTLLLGNRVHNDNCDYRVFLDVKDTLGKQRITLLKNELDKQHAGKSPFIYFQHIHSNESEFLQLTDLFIGAITYKSRNKHLEKGASKIKLKIINYIENHYGYVLDDGTEPWDTKFYLDDFRIKSSKND
jgi:hypothetical protein